MKTRNFSDKAQAQTTICTSFKELARPYQERIARELEQLTFSEFAPLRDPISYFFAIPGKSIRPLLTLITAEHFCAGYESAIPAAIAIEILHDFTLVHDDIMDEDNYRRGHKTLHTKWDLGTAILAGDAMVALAYKKLMQTPSPHLVDMIASFTDCMYVVCEGQARDKEFENREDVTIDEYLLMISQKTARLFSLACELGYLTCAADDQIRQTLKEIGENVGLAFQVRDDLLDYVGDKKELGKDVGSDWRRKKKTYITIVYHQKAKTNRQLPPNLFSLPTISEAKKAIELAGAIEDAQQFVRERLGHVKKIAEAINFAHPLFYQLLDFLAIRHF